MNDGILDWLFGGSGTAENINIIDHSPTQKSKKQKKTYNKLLNYCIHFFPKRCGSWPVDVS